MLNVGSAWQQACHDLNLQGEAYVLITLLGSAGSTPRIAGTKMVITASSQYDTIGGGHLEYTVIDKARTLLEKNISQQEIKHFPLGATLGQCCGGSVSVLFEVIVSKKMHLDIYGAGHIAHHLMQVLEKLPIAIRWIDNRPDYLPQTSSAQTLFTDDPVGELKRAKKGSAFLVLTHNHQLDFDLCHAALTHHPDSWLGVIGSQTKAERFRKRLAHRDIAPSLIDNMVCPVGLNSVQGKEPMEVAISIAGQIISLYQAPIANNKATHKEVSKKTKANRQGVQLQTLRPFILNEVTTQQ